MRAAVAPAFDGGNVAACGEGRYWRGVCVATITTPNGWTAASFLKVRAGGREKSVSEYGDVAPLNSLLTQWPIRTKSVTATQKTESIVEITHEDLPKPGKTTLIDAALRGDQADLRAASVDLTETLPSLQLRSRKRNS